MANAPGDGSITKLRNGRHWVRSPVQPDGKRKSLGTYATREEADEILISFLCLQGTPKALSPNVRTFGKFAPEVLDLREEDGVRGIDKERDRYNFHLSKCLLTDMPLTEIGPPHIAELARALMRKYASDKRGRRKLDRSTAQRVIAIVSSVFNEAVERGHVPANPCVGIKVKARAEDTKGDPWEYADPADQERLATCEAIPLVDRLIIRFAKGTGIRQGELCHNMLADLHVGTDEADPYMFVRWGSKNKPPKSKKTRNVQVFGDALEAIREYLELLKAGKVCKKNPEGLIFPTVNGCRRQSGKPLGNGKKIKSSTHPRGWVWEDRFAKFQLLAGLPKHLRWHDLRHTCASSLVAGWWGRKWTLEEIKEQLGHSSITITQRYAHLGETSLKTAARETPGRALALVRVATPEGAAERSMRDAPPVYDDRGARMPVDASPAEVLRYVREREERGYAVVTAPVGGMSAMACISNDSNEVGRAGVEPATYGLKGRSTYQPFREVSRDGSPLQAPLVTTLAETFLRLVREGQREAALAVGVSLASAALATPGELESRSA